MKSIKEHFNQLGTIDAFENFLQETSLECKIGTLGGRQIILKGYKGRLSIKDLTKKLSTFVASPKISQDLAKKALVAINNLDQKLEKKYLQANLIKRILTIFRRIGNLFFSHAKERSRLQLLLNERMIETDRLYQNAQVSYEVLDLKIAKALGRPHGHALYGPFEHLNRVIELSCHRGAIKQLKLAKALGLDFSRLRQGNMPLLAKGYLMGFPPQVISFLEEEAGLDKAEAIAYLEKKHLAHVFGLKGTSPLPLKSDPLFEVCLEGYMEAKCLSEKKEYRFTSGNYPLKRLAQSLLEGKDLGENGQKIYQALIMSADRIGRSLNESAKLVQEGFPLVLAGGFKDHHVSFTFCNDLLLIGNRGAHSLYDRKGIEIFSLPKKAVTCEMMAKLNRTYLDINSFKEAFEPLNLKWIDYLPMKNQKAGNCLWAGSKCALMALLFASSEKATPRERKAFARKAYKFWSTKERLKTASHYVPTPKDKMWETVALKLPYKVFRYASMHDKQMPPCFRKKAQTVEELKEQIASLNLLIT